MQELIDFGDLGLRVAQALVTSMTSDAWDAAKAGFTQLLQRYGGERFNRLAGRLDADREAVREEASPEIGNRITAEWATRIADLIEENPSSQSEFSQLLSQLGSNAMGDGASVWISARADRKGRNYIAGVGDVNVSGQR